MGNGYQPTYRRTDRPLPNARPVKQLSQEESLRTCYDYHRKQVNDALARTYRADPADPESEVWLSNQHLADANESFGFSFCSVLIARDGDGDHGFLVKNYGSTHDVSWEPAEEIRTPVRWGHSEGMWIK